MKLLKCTLIFTKITIVIYQESNLLVLEVILLMNYMQYTGTQSPVSVDVKKVYYFVQAAGVKRSTLIT